MFGSGVLTWSHCFIQGYFLPEYLARADLCVRIRRYCIPRGRRYSIGSGSSARTYQISRLMRPVANFLALPASRGSR